MDQKLKRGHLIHKDAHDYLVIHGIGAQVAERMSLKQFYTPLQVSQVLACEGL